MTSRAKAVAAALAAVLPGLLAAAPAPAAAAVPELPGVPGLRARPGVPVLRALAPLPGGPSRTGSPLPATELQLPRVELPRPLPVEATTPAVTVAPSPNAGVTATVPSGTVGGVATPPVEVSTPPAGLPPAPPVKAPAPPSLPQPSPPAVPGAGAPSPGVPGVAAAGSSGRAATATPDAGAKPGAGATGVVGSAAGHSGAASPVRRARPPSPGHRGRTSSATGARGTRGSAAPLRAPAPAAALTAAGSRSPRAGTRHGAHSGRSSDPLTSLGRNLPFPIPVPDWSKPVILALLLLALALALRAGVTARRARRLERQRTALLQDIDALQAALVPEIPRQLEGLSVSVAYRPAEGPAAGGDFYDVFSPSPGRVAVVLGDVAGHGHEALRHAALIRYTLRAYVQAGLEPRAALALAGHALEQPVGEYCATVAVGVYDRRGSRLTYALAGHPAPLLRGVDAPEPLTVCSSPAIGWSLPTGRRQTEVALPPGAQVCFFSDGLIEARADGGFVGRDGLEAMLGELGAREGAAELLERIQARTQATPDDMAACILTPQSSIPPEPWHVEELETDADGMQGEAGRRFLAGCGVAPALIEQTLELAESILASSAAVVLRVQRSTNAMAVTAQAASAGSGVPGAARGGALAAGTAGGGPRGVADHPARRAGEAPGAGEGPALLR